MAGSHPSIEPRIVIDEAVDGRLDLAAEAAHGVYEDTGERAVIVELEAARLRGRGGAGFPAHLKWQAVAGAPGPRVVVANGEEGEPASVKDRWLLTHRPHLVLDGLLLAARTVGASRAVVYLSRADTAGSIREAVKEVLAAGLWPDTIELEVFEVAEAYVAGEESAACRAISGGPALPVAKPPRVFESGVGGMPTLVSNVETLAHASWIARNGAAEYLRYGTPDSPGTTLVTLGGACGLPGVYEVPFGLTVAQMYADMAGGFTSDPAGFVMGGWFGGMLSPEHAGVTCCYESVRAVGSGFGCGSITALAADEDPVAVAARIAAWYAEESAQQCGVCIKGTAAIRDAFVALDTGSATEETPLNLTRWGTSLTGRGACAFLDGATTLARSVIDQFPATIGRHIKEKAS